MSDKILSLLKGAGLAAFGAFATYLLRHYTDLLTGVPADLLPGLAALLSVVANAARKYLPPGLAAALKGLFVEPEKTPPVDLAALIRQAVAEAVTAKGETAPAATGEPK